jgi:pimeloyl-ACP methyl ester carboxylesterase
VEHGVVEANGLSFATLALGPTSGPLALCLHGFPDTAHSWRFLLPQLAHAGYRAVAPFTRGYAPTAVPTDGVYQTGALAADANALHEALGADADAVLIGHDWGAPSAYGAAGSEPDRWRAVVGMAVPPGDALAVAFVSNLDQLQRSWYMFVFQHPLADLLVPAADHALIARLWAQWSPGYDAAVDVANVRDALATPESVHAALGYYRAALGDGPRDERYVDSQAAAGAVPPQPTLYLHGANDGCIGSEVADAARASAPDHVRFETIEDAGHFLQLEQPDLVGDLVLEFLEETR